MSLTLTQILNALDKKDRMYYDKLTEKEQKEVSPLLLMRYMSVSDGNADLQEWYLRAANEFINKNHWELSKHKKLQWLLLTCISPKMGLKFHKWLPYPKKNTSNTTKLSELHPDLNDDEIEIIYNSLTEKELKQYVDERAI